MMKRDAQRPGRTDDETQVAAAEEQMSGTDVAGPASAGRKAASEADWLSMTTGDPALYLKDAE